MMMRVLLLLLLLMDMRREIARGRARPRAIHRMHPMQRLRTQPMRREPRSRQRRRRDINIRTLRRLQQVLWKRRNCITDEKASVTTTTSNRRGALTAPREAFTHHLPQPAHQVSQFLHLPSLRRQLLPHPAVFIAHGTKLRSHLLDVTSKKKVLHWR